MPLDFPWPITHSSATHVVPDLLFSPHLCPLSPAIDRLFSSRHSISQTQHPGSVAPLPGLFPLTGMPFPAFPTVTASPCYGLGGHGAPGALPVWGGMQGCGTPGHACLAMSCAASPVRPSAGSVEASWSHGRQSDASPAHTYRHPAALLAVFSVIFRLACPPPPSGCLSPAPSTHPGDPRCFSTRNPVDNPFPLPRTRRSESSLSLPQRQHTFPAISSFPLVLIRRN